MRGKDEGSDPQKINKMKDCLNYHADIPHEGDYDIVVLGGGPAGVCAAVEAARNGARTLLVERSGMLGGMATSALVGPLMTSYDRDGARPVVGGLYREIVDRLQDKGGVILPEEAEASSVFTSYIGAYHAHVTPIDSFRLQIVLDDLTEEAGVDVLLYTRFVDVCRQEDTLSCVILLKLQGLRHVSARYFIDATGNADVAVSAGVPTWKGEEQTHVPQPGTLMFEVDGVEDERYQKRPENPVKAYRLPEKGCYKINHYHVYNIDATNSESMSQAHKEARRQVLDAFLILKDRTPGFEKARISQVAPVLGIRESRHVRGEYCLTATDLSEGKKFDDRIAAYAFGIDVHSRNTKEKGNFKIPTANVYYVPYRSLIPLGCRNLLIAGKTISCESQAAGAIRVMPCAMAIGQAAGAAVAIACSRNGDVRQVPVNELQTVLRCHNAILD